MSDENEKQSWLSFMPYNLRNDKEVSDGAKMLYLFITSLCHADGYCWATNKYLAEQINVKEREIQKRLLELKTRGYIDSIIIRNEKNQVVERRIFLKLYKENEGNQPPHVQNDTPSCPKRRDPHVQKDVKNKTRIEESNISPRETYSYPSSVVSKGINVTNKDTHMSLSGSSRENQAGNGLTECSPRQAEEAKDFDTFWELYPKHCGKIEARKAFSKHVRHEDMGELLSGLDKYKRTKQWSESKYIPYPSTFLNQERWKDGVEPDYKNWDEMSDAERGLMEEVLGGVDPNDLR